MMSAQAGVRRVPWRSRHGRTGDPSIDRELINGAKGGLDLAHGCAMRIRPRLKEEVMMSAQAGVRRVPWRSRHGRTGDPSIDRELINGAKGGLDLAHGCAMRIRPRLKEEVMMSAQAGVRRVPWRSRHGRTGDPSIDRELINGAKGGTRTPTCQGTQDPEPGVKSINNNNLQHEINLNNKKRVDLRAAQIASECGALLPKIGDC